MLSGILLEARTGSGLQLYHNGTIQRRSCVDYTCIATEHAFVPRFQTGWYYPYHITAVLNTQWDLDLAVADHARNRQRKQSYCTNTRTQSDGLEAYERSPLPFQYCTGEP